MFSKILHLNSYHILETIGSKSRFVKHIKNIKRIIQAYFIIIMNNSSVINLPVINLPVINLPSPEQQIIINHIKSGNNVIVDACAGSGKSTTILLCALAMPDKLFLQITYNAALRKDIITKAKQYNISNLEIHTYHSLAVKYFLRSAYTDTGIRNILYNNLENLIPLPNYNIVVLDESQDMTILYYRLIVYFTKKISGLFQLLVLGDWMQGLYEFKGADTRFLTLGKQIWQNYSKLSSPIFYNCILQVSYRITKPMSEFVNRIMLGKKRMISIKDGQPVMYIRNSRTTIEKIVVLQIKKLLLLEGVLPSDIFVLGGSVSSSNSNIRKMENALVEAQIPTFVPLIETSDKLDERVIQGKVVFSTFHSVKGMERKYVFIVGFDNSYFTFCARNLPTIECPNTLYVGCTRATHGLYLLENNQWNTDRPLDFLRKTHHEMKNECSEYVDFKGLAQTIFYKKPKDDEKLGIPTYNVTPTSLIKFISESVIDEITPLLDDIFISASASDIASATAATTVTVTTLTEPEIFDFTNINNSLFQTLEIDIPNIIKTRRGFHEDVSILNGIAIPFIYSEIMKAKWIDASVDSTESKHTILYDIIDSKIKDMKPNEHLYLKQIFQEMSPTSKEPSDYLYMANMFISINERLYYNLKQIDQDEYTWLSPEILEKCKTRLDSIIEPDCIDQFGVSQNPIFEETIIHHTMDQEHLLLDKAILEIYGNDAKFKFSGRVDLITEKTVWELKCTSQISIDHLLQVTIYAWIWRIIYQNRPEFNKQFKLLNIKTGEIKQLNATLEQLNQIMGKLLKGKYAKMERLSDDEFLQEIGKIGKPMFLKCIQLTQCS